MSNAKKKSRKIKDKALKRKRTEFFKSVLIFTLLTVFCLLTYVTFKDQSLSADGNMSHSLFGTEILSEKTDAVNLYFSYTAPEYVLFNTAAAREVFYNNTENYSKAQSILQDIDRNIFLSDIEIEKAETDLFDNIGETELLYICYPYHRYPLLAAQFFENPSPEIAEYISSYKRIILMPSESDKEGINVYIRDEKTSGVYKIITKVPSSGLSKVIKSTKKLDDRNYSFAYELNLTPKADSDTAVTELKPDIVIPLKTQFLPVVSVSPPYEAESLLSGFSDESFSSTVIRAFGFQESNIRQYIDKDDILVCVSENATLKLYPDGVVEYNSINTKSGLNLMGNTRLTTENSYFLSFMGISSVINSVVPLAENNERSFKIRLTDLQSESSEVAEYKFIFDYYLNGTRIMPSPYHAIEATAVNGYLTSMRIDLKRFENTSDKAAVEPLFSAIDRYCASKQPGSAVSVSECFRIYPLGSDGETLKGTWSVK